MSDPPLPPAVPPELEKEYREFLAEWDAYLERWKTEVRKFMQEKGAVQKQPPEGNS